MFSLVYENTLPDKTESSIKIVLMNVCTLCTPEVYNVKSPQLHLMVVITMMMLILIMMMILILIMHVLSLMMIIMMMVLMR